MKKINKKLSLKKEIVAQLDKAGMNQVGGNDTTSAIRTRINCGSGPCNSDRVACYPTYRCGDHTFLNCE